MLYPFKKRDRHPVGVCPSFLKLTTYHSRQIPWRLLRRAPELSEVLTGHDDHALALGCCFLPRDAELADAEAPNAASRRTVEETCAASGCELLGWRRVPVNPGVLGPSGRATLPAIWHFVLARPSGVAAGDAFERRLYLVRRRLEKALATAHEGAEGHQPAMVSLSCRC